MFEDGPTVALVAALAPLALLENPETICGRGAPATTFSFLPRPLNHIWGSGLYLAWILRPGEPSNGGNAGRGLSRCR